MKKQLLIIFLFISSSIFCQEEKIPTRLSFRIIPTLSNWNYDGETKGVKFFNTGVLSDKYEDEITFNRFGGGLNLNLAINITKEWSIGVFCESEIFGVYFNRGKFFEFPDINSFSGGIVEYKADQNVWIQLISGYELGADDLNGWRNGVAFVFLLPQKELAKNRIGLKMGVEYKRIRKQETVEDFSPSFGSTTKTSYNVHSAFIKLGLFIYLQGKKRNIN